MDELELDEIGPWSEIKLEIIREYAKPYSQILAKQPNLHHIYIDGFAGAGLHLSKESGQQVSGSPIRVVEVEPRFRAYHLVELNPLKAAHLRTLFASNPSVHIHEGDCNDILPEEILPTVEYRKYRRAFCLLDPYGLQLSWRVIDMAARMGTIDLLLNFPTMAINRGVLWSDPDRVRPSDVEQMTRFWGDESWRDATYQRVDTLFGDEQAKLRGNQALVQAFRRRLIETAGFRHVPEPLEMRIPTGQVIYHLFLASQIETAARIIKGVFKRRSV